MSASLVPPAFFLLALAAPAALMLAPDEGGAVAVLAPAIDGGARAMGVVAAAGGRALAVRSGSLVIARSDEPGFVGRLYQAGALLVVRADSSACGSSNPAGLL